MVSKAFGGITAATLLAVGGGTFKGVEVLDSRYAPAGQYATKSEVVGLATNMAIGQFYDRLDDYEESLAEGRDRLAARYKQELERLLTEICEQKPTFVYCTEGIPDE